MPTSSSSAAGRAPCSASSAPTATPSATTPTSSGRWPGASCACTRAAPTPCRARARSATAMVVPDNVPLTVRTTSGKVSFRGYRGSARVTTRSGDVDVAGFCGFSLQARAETGDIAGERRVRAPAADAALDQGLGARVGADGALPGRGRERRGWPRRPRPGCGVRRAVLDPGPQQLGRRPRRGASVIAALDLDRRLERAAHAAAYLVVNVPIAILGALSVARALPGRRAERGVDRPAAAARRRGGMPAARCASTGAPPTTTWARTSRPVPAGVATAGNPWRRSLDILSDRALWRMVALLATKPLLIAGLCAVALVPLALLAEIISLGVQGVGGLGTIDYLGPWRAGPGPRASRCWPWSRPPRCSSMATLDALYAVLSHDRPRAAGAARGAERAGARDAGREPGRPLGEHRLLAARPRGVRRRGRPARSRCPSRDRGARGPRSSRTGAAWRRSSTTPRWTRARSSSRRPRRRPRWRSTTSA